MTDKTNTPKLYILARTDLASLTGGRLAAQAAHAAHLFATKVTDAIVADENSEVSNAFSEWEGQGGGYGTVIVLDGTDIETIRTVVWTVGETFAGMVRDTSYPAVDGDVVVLTDIETVGYVFYPGDAMSEDKAINLHDGFDESYSVTVGDIARMLSEFSLI